jgi:hypothetical protein
MFSNDEQNSQVQKHLHKQGILQFDIFTIQI